MVYSYANSIISCNYVTIWCFGSVNVTGKSKTIYSICNIYVVIMYIFIYIF